MLNSITLFEIPIYSMSEQDFDNKWKRKFHNELIEAGVEEKYSELMQWRLQRQPQWKYSQIVAWIVVYYRKHPSEITIETHGELFHRNGKREGKRVGFAFNRSKLPHIHVIHHNCNKFNVSLDKNNCFFYRTNREIRKKIKSYVNYEISTYAQKPLFADTVLFDRTIDYIDILKVIENHLKQENPNE